MRHALPIFWCLDYDTQVKLAKMVDDVNSIQPCQWKEWPVIEFVVTPLDLGDLEGAREYYDKLMRKAPSRSRG